MSERYAKERDRRKNDPKHLADYRAYQREWLRQRREDPEFVKQKREYKKAWRDQSLSYKWTNDRQSAKARGLEWTISRKTHELLSRSDCAYCGAHPEPFNGIDRIDNMLGYTGKNVAPACFNCNFAKRRMTVFEFITWARRLAQFSRER